MIYVGYIIAYLFVGFVATMSPAGQLAWNQLDIPPFLFLLLWPILLPATLLITGGMVVNDWLEEIIR